MFGIGPRNPQRVAQKQLNQAKLELLEVSGALENCEAQKAALEKRIERLTRTLGESVETKITEDKKSVRKIADRVRSEISIIASEA